MTHVALRSLSRHFDSTVAVDNIDLDVECGQLIALLGASGCGKTTTLRMISGLLDPTDGSIEFDGQSVTSVPTEKRGAVMVFQKHLLFPSMSVAQNVGFGLKMAKVPAPQIDKTVGQMLDRVRLRGFGDRRAHELSGGQQQRVALARALAVEPRVLLLDEPLASLDANLRKEMRQELRGIQDDFGVTTIMVTHDQEDAVMLADQVALMDEGRILQFGPVADFYDRPVNAQVAEFFGNPNELAGMVDGDTVTTAAGMLHHTQAGLAAGSVRVTVRPEAIEISEHPGKNTVSALVVSASYRGTHTDLEIKLGGELWTMQARVADRIAAGDNIEVFLPPEAVWLY